MNPAKAFVWTKEGWWLPSMLSSYCTCLSSVLGETFVRHHQKNLIQLIAATLVRISRPGKHFLIETEDEDTESSNPLDGNKDASRDAFKEHRDTPAPIKNTPIANKIMVYFALKELTNILLKARAPIRDKNIQVSQSRILTQATIGTRRDWRQWKHQSPIRWLVWCWNRQNEGTNGPKKSPPQETR